MIELNSGGRITVFFSHQTENFYCYEGRQNGRKVTIYLPITNRAFTPRQSFETIVEIQQNNDNVDNAVKENVYERHTELLTEISKTLVNIENSVSHRVGHFEIPTSVVVDKPIKRKYTRRVKKIARKRSTKRTKK